MQKIILFTCMLFYITISIAQSSKIKLTGIIKSIDGHPLEAISVMLMLPGDSSLYRSALSDKQGQYIFSKVSYGSYILSVRSTTFQDYKQSLTISDSNALDFNLPPVTLLPITQNMTGITVVTQKPFVERKIDKLVVNVASASMSAGKSALDLFDKLPGVSIDDNGNISINGKQGVQLYVDGKTIYLAGQDLINFLRGLPAGQLDQVEIITQPSAKYDAAGNAGILNLKIKKNQLEGFNGSITSSALFGFYFKNRDNLALYLKKNKLSFSLNYGFTYYKQFVDQHINRAFRNGYGSGFSQYLDQSLWNVLTFTPSNPRFTIDYEASKNTLIGIAISGSFSRNTYSAIGPTEVLDSLQRKIRNEESNQYISDPVSNLGVNLNLQQKLDQKGKELSVNADYVYYHRNNSQITDNYFYDAKGNPLQPYLINSNLPSDIDIYSIRSDYSQPINFHGNTSSNSFHMEAGFKSSYVKTDNNAQYLIFDTLQKSWHSDTSQNNHFLYTENINAVYLSLSKQIQKQLTIQLGLRGEQTLSKGNELIQKSQFRRDYFQLFPTAFLSYSLNPKNTITFTYGRRIDRPNYQDLNPFRSIIDKYSLYEGNPLLKPVFTNNIEIGYNYKGQLDIAINYTKTNGLINTIINSVQQGNDFISIQTRQNLNSRTNMGLAINFNKPLTKWWNFYGYASVFNNRITDNTTSFDTVYSITSYRINLNNQFPLKKGWTLDLSGFYLSRRTEGLLMFVLPSGAFSFGFSKKLMNGKSTFTLNMNDPFWWFQGPVIKSETPSFTFKKINGRENRYLTATFSYRFGKAIQPAKHKINGSAQEEQNRVNF